MWTSENRPKYNRDKLRYPSDLTDDEWSHIEPIIPPAKRGGRKRSVEPREIVNGLMYVLSTGCQWRYVPKDLPPKSTLFGYFDLWRCFQGRAIARAMWTTLVYHYGGLNP
jgi:transposase